MRPALSVGPILAATLAALTIGIGDQNVSAFADARLTGLHLKAARLVVPYDAATSEPDRVQTWLNAVRVAGMEPHVAFEHLRSDHCPSSPCTLPSRASYRANVVAFLARFPQVKTYTAWNEANHVSQPTASRPEAAAGFYLELEAACPSCTIVAGDVLDSGSYLQWLRRFQQVASAQLWGLHNYSDVTYGTTSGTDAVLAATTGTLWVEETGGIVVRRDAAGRILLAADEARAARAVSAAFALARTRPRITRMYVYQWRAGATDQFDSGLVRPDGTERPSYVAFVAGLKAVPRTASPGVAWKASWQRERLVLRHTCITAPCRGTVTVKLRGSSRMIKTLGTRRYATKMLRLKVSAKVRRALRRATRRRVSLTVTSTKPVAARQSIALKLAKP